MFKVYEEKTDDPCRLRLIGESDGGVVLVVVDADGEEVVAGRLARVTPEGRLELSRGVNAEVPIDRTGGGRIRLILPFEEPDERWLLEFDGDTGLELDG